MFEPKDYLKTLFSRLRNDGLNLSIKEYFAALDAIEEGWGTKDKEDLKKLLRLLWCKSYEQQSHLAMIVDLVVVERKETEKSRGNLLRDLPLNTIPIIWLLLREINPIAGILFLSTSLKNELKKNKDSSQTNIDFPSTKVIDSNRFIQNPQTIVTKPATQNLSTLPITTPRILQEYEDDSELVTHYPISRRFMVYAWRYLRRPIADGVRDVLDIKMTVEEATKQGFFLQPAYCRREQNHAHLLFLVDQEGSMTPFHHFSRDLIETAQYESSMERVDVGYFHNLPAEYIYKDPFLTAKIPLEEVLSQCDSETRVLILSDGGAARGYRRRERISATTEVIWKIQQHTNLIAWLNPVPHPRWNSTSAKIISHLVPMFSMTQDGLIQAISTLQR